MSKKYLLFQSICESKLQKPLILSSTTLLKNLNIDVSPLPDSTGLGDLYFGMTSGIESLFSAAKNMAIANREKGAILCLENISYDNFKKAHATLVQNPKLQSEFTAKLLELGLHFSMDVEIVHIVELLHDAVGVEYIKSRVEHNFSDFSAGLFFGSMSDDAIDKKSAAILEAVGAKVAVSRLAYNATYLEQLPICKDFAFRASGEVFLDIVDNGVDFITSLDSSAFVMFDQCQKEIEKAVGRDDVDMPFLHLAQVVALAMGIHAKDTIGLDLHKAKVALV